MEAGMAHRAGEGGFAQHNGATLNINPNPSPCQSPTPTRTLTLRCTLPYSYLINIRQPQYDLQPQPYPPPFRYTPPSPSAHVAAFVPGATLGQPALVAKQRDRVDKTGCSAEDAAFWVKGAATLP